MVPNECDHLERRFAGDGVDEHVAVNVESMMLTEDGVVVL